MYDDSIYDACHHYYLGTNQLGMGIISIATQIELLNVKLTYSKIVQNYLGMTKSKKKKNENLQKLI